MLNAITPVWRSQEVPASIVRAIYRHALDCRNGAGTSSEATVRIVDEINAIVAARRCRKGFRCTVRMLAGRQVTVSSNGLIARTLRSGGSAVVDVRCGESTHAMPLVGVDAEHWTFFDPYQYQKTPHYRRGIELARSPWHRPRA